MKTGEDLSDWRHEDEDHSSGRKSESAWFFQYAGGQFYPCVQKDDVEKFRQDILEADMMVFVTPLYYYGMSAQLKILIDRFCAFNSSIQRKRMKSALLTAAWNSDGWTFDALEAHYKEAHYKTLVHYLNLKDMGMVLGKGCGTPSMTQHSKYPEQAYELGKKLK